MRLKIYMLLTTVFLLSCATFCCEDYGDSPVNVQLTGINITHLDYSGIELIKTDLPIKKEAFVMGINFILKDSTDNAILYPFKSNYTLINPIEKTSVYYSSDFAGYTAGSDISDCFKKTNRNSDKYELLFLLRKIPAAGTYTFRIKLECRDSTIIEKESLSVSLF